MNNNPDHGYRIEPKWMEEQDAFFGSPEHNLCEWLIGLGIVIVVILWATS
jgi:hypothetical protein